MNARCVYSAQDRDWLTANFSDAYNYLGVTNVSAEDFVELFLGLLRSQPRHMDASSQRHLYVTFAVNAHLLIGELSQFRRGNLQLVTRPQQVGGAYLIAALRLQFVRFRRCRRRRNLRKSAHA